jgi:hypothetical protein
MHQSVDELNPQKRPNIYLKNSAQFGHMQMWHFDFVTKSYKNHFLLLEGAAWDTTRNDVPHWERSLSNWFQ